MHDYDEGVADDARDRRDIADEIEVELLIKRRIDGVVRCGKEEGIAIWGSADDRLGAEIGASAGPVFDDEWLAEPLRQPLADHARNDVSRAARGKWHDQTHRPRRVGLRPCNTRHGRQRRRARGQMQKSSAGKFHSALPAFRATNPFTASLRLDVRGPDHFAPLLSILDDVIAELGG